MKCLLCGKEYDNEKTHRRYICQECDEFDGPEPCTRTETEYQRIVMQRDDLIAELEAMREEYNRMRYVLQKEMARRRSEAEDGKIS